MPSCRLAISPSRCPVILPSCRLAAWLLRRFTISPSHYLAATPSHRPTVLLSCCHAVSLPRPVAFPFCRYSASSALCEPLTETSPSSSTPLPVCSPGEASSGCPSPEIILHRLVAKLGHSTYEGRTLHAVNHPTYPLPPGGQLDHSTYGGATFLRLPISCGQANAPSSLPTGRRMDSSAGIWLGAPPGL